MSATHHEENKENGKGTWLGRSQRGTCLRAGSHGNAVARVWTSDAGEGGRAFWSAPRIPVWGLAFPRVCFYLPHVVSGPKGGEEVAKCNTQKLPTFFL